MRAILTYASSTLLHVVVLGGLAGWIPWGDMGPGFSLARGNGGQGQNESPLGSAGGSEPAEVIHLELLPFRARLAEAVEDEIEPPPEAIAISSFRPAESEAETPVATVASTRREMLEDVAPPTIQARVEVSEAGPLAVAVNEMQLRQNEAMPPAAEPAEPPPRELSRRESTEAPPTGEVRVVLPELIDIGGRGVAGTGTGAGRGDGNGGGAGREGGRFDSPHGGPINPPPPYPPELERAGIEGTVFIRVQISAEGTVTSAVVETSSGWPRFDESALVTIKSRWRFQPALKGGVAVESELRIPCQFYIRRS